MSDQHQKDIQQSSEKNSVQREINDGAHNIYEHMKELFSKQHENDKRRWIWELIQNAKDSCVLTQNKKASISISYEKGQEKFIFSHNGDIFSWDELWALIRKTSGKNIDNRTINTSGKYGTGFCTTHFVSKLITVSGKIKNKIEDRETIDEFYIPIDRSSVNEISFRESIKSTYDVYFNSIKKQSNFNENEFNTVFTYHGDGKSIKLNHENIDKGLKELDEYAKFALNFIDIIQQIEVNCPNGKKKYQVNNILSPFVNNEIYVINEYITNENTSQKLIISHTEHIDTNYEGNTISVPVTISFAISKEGNIIHIEEYDKQPKLYIFLPLIGSEQFMFPIIIHSPYFSPAGDQRSNIELTEVQDSEAVNLNKKIVEKAIDMYEQLLKFIESDKSHTWKHLYNIIKIGKDKGNDSAFAQIQITRLSEVVIEHISVETNKNIKQLLGNPELKLFEKENNQLWDICDKCKNIYLPLKEEHGQWAKQLLSDKKVKERFTEAELAKYIHENVDDKELLERLDLGEFTLHGWLNQFYKIIGDSKLFQKYDIILNKKGMLCSSEEAKYSNDIKDEIYIDVYSLFKESFTDELIDTKLTQEGQKLREFIKPNDESKIQENVPYFIKSYDNKKIMERIKSNCKPELKLDKEKQPEIYFKQLEVYIKILSLHTGELKDTQKKLLEILRALDISELQKIFDNIDKNKFLYKVTDFNKELLYDSICFVLRYIVDIIEHSNSLENLEQIITDKSIDWLNQFTHYIDTYSTYKVEQVANICVEICSKNTVFLAQDGYFYSKKELYNESEDENYMVNEDFKYIIDQLFSDDILSSHLLNTQIAYTIKHDLDREEKDRKSVEKLLKDYGQRLQDSDKHIDTIKDYENNEGLLQCILDWLEDKKQENVAKAIVPQLKSLIEKSFTTADIRRLMELEEESRQLRQNQVKKYNEIAEELNLDKVDNIEDLDLNELVRQAKNQAQSSSEVENSWIVEQACKRGQTAEEFKRSQEQYSNNSGNHIYTTERGEKVRSKSEVIIANLLNKFNIPYRYEEPFKGIEPDFTIKNKDKSIIIYWEHSGTSESKKRFKSKCEKEYKDFTVLYDLVQFKNIKGDQTYVVYTEDTDGAIQFDSEKIAKHCELIARVLGYNE